MVLMAGPNMTPWEKPWISVLPKPWSRPGSTGMTMGAKPRASLSSRAWARVSRSASGSAFPWAWKSCLMACPRVAGSSSPPPQAARERVKRTAHKRDNIRFMVGAPLLLSPWFGWAPSLWGAPRLSAWQYTIDPSPTPPFYRCFYDPRCGILNARPHPTRPPAGPPSPPGEGDWQAPGGLM